MKRRQCWSNFFFLLKFIINTVWLLCFFTPISIQINSLPGSGSSSHSVKQQQKAGLNALPLEMTKTLATNLLPFLMGKILSVIPWVFYLTMQNRGQGSRAPRGWFDAGQGGEHICSAGSPGRLGAAQRPSGHRPNMHCHWQTTAILGPAECC